jgi:tRNA-Thr(GGU) m(6)t(6)A37 methyltransferase TsaA
MKPAITFIGIILSPLKKLEDCPLQESENAPEAYVKIFPDFFKGIKDISPGTEILVLTWLHLADRNILECKPRNNQQAQMKGLFSTRTPDRPNPIGIHKVKVLFISEDGMIKISPMEALGQTPVVDIKPILNK